MKLSYWSWLLGLQSYVIGGVFRRSAFPADVSMGMHAALIILLLLLPAAVGCVLGVMSWRRREVNPWLAVGSIVLNLDMVFTGILLLSPG